MYLPGADFRGAEEQLYNAIISRNTDIARMCLQEPLDLDWTNHSVPKEVSTLLRYVY